MVLNDGKEQVYGPSKQIRDAWELQGRGKAVPTARDLGIFHCSRGWAHPALSSRVKELRGVAARFGSIPAPRRTRGLMGAAVFFGKVLYGCESQYIPQSVFQALGNLMGRAIRGGKARPGPGPSHP